jgi:hypothetical protein
MAAKLSLSCLELAFDQPRVSRRDAQKIEFIELVGTEPFRA